MDSSRRATAGGRGPFPETYGQWWTILEALPREALFVVARTFCAGLISLSRTTERMEEQNVAILEEFQRTAGDPDALSSALLERLVSAMPIFRGVEAILEHAAVQAADPYADAVRSQLARVTECCRVLKWPPHTPAATGFGGGASHYASGVNRANATLQWPTAAIPWNTPARPGSPSVGLCQVPKRLLQAGAATSRSRSRPQRSRQPSSSRSRSPLRRRPAVHLEPAKTSGKASPARPRPSSSVSFPGLDVS